MPVVPVDDAADGGIDVGAARYRPEPEVGMQSADARLFDTVYPAGTVTSDQADEEMGQVVALEGELARLGVVQGPEAEDELLDAVVVVIHIIRGGDVEADLVQAVAVDVEGAHLGRGVDGDGIALGNQYGKVPDYIAGESLVLRYEEDAVLHLLVQERSHALVDGASLVNGVFQGVVLEVLPAQGLVHHFDQERIPAAFLADDEDAVILVAVVRHPLRQLLILRFDRRGSLDEIDIVIRQVQGVLVQR